MKLYSIKELISVDIDSWVEAMATVDDVNHEEAAERLGHDFECASDEGEEILTKISEERKYRFDERGNYVGPAFDGHSDTDEVSVDFK